MSNLLTIVEEEINQFFTELFDPNGGNLYEPPGLDLTHVKQFEESEEEKKVSQ